MGNSNQTLKNVNQTQNVLEEIRNNTLRGINLENQQIGIEGAKVLANALEENSSVTDIILDSNIIGDEGVTALANALEKNKTVTKIYLSHNNIGNEGARVLASALEKNTTLKKIDLSSNFISREGAEVLINALKKNKTLVYIDISKNKISESDSIALAIDLKGDIRARINLSDWDRVIQEISYVPIVGDILKGVPLSSPMKFEKAQTIKMINSKHNVKQKVTHTVAAVQQKVEVSKNILPEQKILYNQVMKQVSTVAQSKVEEAYAKEEEQVQEVDMNAVLKEVGTQTKLNAQDIEILQDMLMEERAARMEEKAAREKMQEELDQLKKLLLKNS